jgi:hypothetical protein
VRLNWQGADPMRPGGKRLQALTSWSFVTAALGGLVLLASLLVLAAPAHGRPADELRQSSAAHPGTRVGSAEVPILRGEAKSRGGLPFARPDLVILVLGGAIVTVAALGAPLLLRPPRAIPPVFVGAAAQSEPRPPATVQGAAAHASA